MKKYYYKRVWGSIGFIVNLSQMIEYNLSNILALDEILSAFENKDSMYSFEYKKLVESAERWYEILTKKELGKLETILKRKDVFEDMVVQEIDFVREERNYFVHQIFKDDLKTREFQNNPKQYLPQLQELVGRMNDLNEILCEIFKEMKEEIKLIY